MADKPQNAGAGQERFVPGRAQAEGLRLIQARIHSAEHGKREASSLPAAIMCLHATSRRVNIKRTLHEAASWQRDSSELPPRSAAAPEL